TNGSDLRKVGQSHLRGGPRKPEYSAGRGCGKSISVKTPHHCRGNWTQAVKFPEREKINPVRKRVARDCFSTPTQKG
ncbi:hypothetical protein ACLOJK_008700, partial [Asimina triloba]